MTETAFTFRRTFWPVLLTLLAGFALAETTSLDLWVQDHFFNFETGKWLIDVNAPLPRLFFYDGPKVCLFLLAAALLSLALGPARWRERLAWRRVDIWIVLACLATGPLLIGTGKATTNIFCPYQLERYDGSFPYRRLLEPWPEGKKPAQCGRCFPAGHASGGFALLSLAGLAATRRGRRIGLAMGLLAGCAMGGYQMLRGAHFLSHTVVTALVCWLVFLFWRRLLRAEPASP